MYIGIRDLKAHLSAVLERVKAGEEVVVTERGAPIVRLERIAAPAPPPGAARLVAQGRLIYKPRVYTFPSALPWTSDGKSSTDYVREQRQ